MEKEAFDVSRRFVRVVETRANGMVEFEFAVGEPEMAVELILPKPAFDEFCKSNRVEFLTDARTVAIDADAADADFNWNLHQATHQRFR